MKIYSFEEAVQKAFGYKKHLLLGNGFSIACKPDIFTYQTLYEQADFSSIQNAKALFESLDTTDFEVVVYSLEQAAKILDVYDPNQKNLKAQLLQDADAIKHLLIDTVAKNHPSRPNDISDDQYRSCRLFLSQFLDKNKNEKGSVYTLSYDLLLYWSLMHQEEFEAYDFVIDDGFNRDFLGFESGDGTAEFAPDVTWQGETQAHHQTIHFLHGALHLYDKGDELQKYTWIDSGVALTEQARFSIDNGFYPLFVSEGNTESKLTKIKHSAYLHKAYRSFIANTNQTKAAFFTYGFSFSENDEHIIKGFRIGKNPLLIVGVFGDMNSKENQRIVKVVDTLNDMRSPKNELEAIYYDVETANVWG